MSRYLSADEARKEFLADYNNPGGEIINKLYQEIANLYYKWFEFQALFGSLESASLLKSIAPTFSRYLHYLILDDIALTVSRLIDPKKSAGHDTASFEGLIGSINDRSKQEAFTKKLDKLRESCEPIKNHRDQRLAHNDLNVIIGKERLPNVSRDEIKEILHIASELYNDIEGAIRGELTVFDFDGISDADLLIERLENKA